MFNSRRRLIIASMISVFFLISFLSVPRLERAWAENPPANGGEKASQAPAGISYLMIDADSKQVLLQANENARIAPASTTKLLTGLVAMQGLKEGEVVQVGNEVVMENSGLNLQPGDKITVDNLLKAMYLMSANDAAAALAAKAGGTVEAFVQSMNQYAQNLGCTGSHFANPHGLDNPDHYSTAADMTKIGLAFLKQADLKKYTGMKQATITWERANGQKVSVQANNINLLLGKYPGDEGLKTGTTTNAGQCLISYVTRPDGNTLLALFGSSRRYSETTALLDRGYAELRVLKALQNVSAKPDHLFQSTGLF